MSLQENLTDILTALILKIHYYVTNDICYEEIKESRTQFHNTAWNQTRLRQFLFYCKTSQPVTDSGNCELSFCNVSKK